MRQRNQSQYSAWLPLKWEDDSFATWMMRKGRLDVAPQLVTGDRLLSYMFHSALSLSLLYFYSCH